LLSDQPTLGDVIAGLLDEAGDVESPIDREYARAGITFAARPAEDVVELRLGEEIADAAMRTPDTGLSDRGPSWIRFAPRDWDDHAFDRLEAWFLVAWRLAGKGH
jgi:hypothetical protein